MTILLQEKMRCTADENHLEATTLQKVKAKIHANLNFGSVRIEHMHDVAILAGCNSATNVTPAQGNGLSLNTSRALRPIVYGLDAKRHRRLEQVDGSGTGSGSCSFIGVNVKGKAAVPYPGTFTGSDNLRHKYDQRLVLRRPRRHGRLRQRWMRSRRPTDLYGDAGTRWKGFLRPRSGELAGSRAQWHDVLISAVHVNRMVTHASTAQRLRATAR
jgi:hypothetical protein